MESSSTEGLLSPYRVLDLTGAECLLCGKILADLGADVIRIEGPKGDTTRSQAPFFHDRVSPDLSLFHFHFNANKRSITLDIECTKGKEIFKRLVEKADAVLESFPPGTMTNLGLGYEDLLKVNSRLVMTAISPFGQSGPYRDFKASDLTLWCLGGMAYVSGDPDRAPVQVSSPQSYLHGAAAAATATLIALYFRELTGESQWVDVSIQEGELKDYLLRMVGILNIALASSNIPGNLTREEADKYMPIIEYVKSQYKAILGSELAIPNSFEEMLKTLRYIILDLPKSLRVDYKNIEEYNDSAKKALMAA